MRVRDGTSSRRKWIALDGGVWMVFYGASKQLTRALGAEAVRQFGWLMPVAPGAAIPWDFDIPRSMRPRVGAVVALIRAVGGEAPGA